jgi:hypothetical protein
MSDACEAPFAGSRPAFALAGARGMTRPIAALVALSTRLVLTLIAARGAAGLVRRPVKVGREPAKARAQQRTQPIATAKG